MFGDDVNQTNTTDDAVNPALPPPDTGAPLVTPTGDDSSASPVSPSLDDISSNDGSSISASDSATAVTNDDTSSSDTTADDSISAAPPALPAIDDGQDGDDTDTSAAQDDTTDTADTPIVSADTEQLVDIKQQALEQLSPLVDKLDQNPEERFRTTMMMIQASDNQALVKQAFEVAQTITDDKARAQALLDVINEINYFTTQSSKV